MVPRAVGRTNRRLTRRPTGVAGNATTGGCFDEEEDDDDDEEEDGRPEV